MKALKKILKIAAYGVIIILILLIVLAGLTQTAYFKNRLRVLLTSMISPSMNGSLQLGMIRGNFITGFSIDSVNIFFGDQTFLHTGRVTANYDALNLYQKKLTFDDIIIDQPVIQFLRSNDGQWNITQLFKPSEDTTSSKFDWEIVLNNVELRNAMVKVVDSLSLTESQQVDSPYNHVNYGNFSVHDVNVKLSASITSKEFDAQIHKAACYMAQPRIDLNQLKGDFTLTNRGMIAKDILIQTNRSFIELDAQMREFNLFKGFHLGDLQHKPVELRLRAPKIDLTELKTFIQPIDFLEGSVFLEIDAQGEFGNLSITQLNLLTYESSFTLSGNLQNLHKPEDLYLDIMIRDSRIVPGDAAKLLPPFGIPTFSKVGPTAIVSEFTGTPLDFKTRTTLTGDIGEVVLDGTMNLKNTPPSYDFSFKTKNLILGKVIEVDDINTSLYTRGTILGKGFSFDDIAAKLKVSIDSARIQNIALHSSELQITANPNHIDATSSLSSQTMKAEISAHGNFSNSNRPTFGGELFLSSIDLAKLFNNPQYQSDLTLRGKIEGSGKTIDDISTKIHLSLLPSLIHQYKLHEEEISFELDQEDRDNKQLTLESSIANVELTGKFDLDLAAEALAHQTSNLIHEIRNHISPSHQLPSGKTISRLNIGDHTPSEREQNFHYTFQVKNLEPLAGIFKTPQFNARGNFTGTAHGTDENLSLSCEGKLDEFYIGSIKEGIILHNSTFTIELDSLTDVHTLEQFSGKVDINIQTGLLNKIQIDSTRLSFNYNEQKGIFFFEGTVDTNRSISLLGNVSVQPNTYVFDLEKFILTTHGHTWQNNQDVQFRLTTDGLRVMHATIQRDDEVISFAGMLHHTGEFKLTGVLSNYDISLLNIWIQHPELSKPQNNFTGSVNADLQFSGTTASPTINFEAISTNTSFRGTQIGRVYANIQYNDQHADINIDVRKGITDTVPSLVIKGMLPINLGLTDVKERFPDKTQHLTVISDHFDVNILDPLLAEFENLTGVLVCNLTISGTPQQPQYSGTISFSDIRFIFVPNNVGYMISGEFQPLGEKIIAKQLIVKNIPEKGLNAESKFTGSLSIKDFKISSFDFTAHGEFLLMTDASRKTVSTMYGTLLTEISSDGLKIQGTLERPFLSGNLFVREANLVFPPTKPVDAGNSNLILNYIVVDDTSQKSSQEQWISKFYLSQDTTTTSTQKKSLSPGTPLLDRLRYNLNVETKGTTAIRMIFTPATNEELYAELEGKVIAVNEQGTPSIYGEISVSRQSFYNFFKKFDATGTLKFVGPWDNPELAIEASYIGFKQNIQLKNVETTSGSPASSDDDQKSTQQKVVVDLKITGTRKEPKLEMSMKVQVKPGGEFVDWSGQAKGGDVQSDVISFILTGKFRDELTSQDEADIATSVGASTGSSVVSGVTSSLLSGILTDFLKQEFPFIRTAEISYRGGSLQESADLRLSGEAFKGYWRFGGKILNNIGNANVSYQLNLGEVFNTQSIRNFFLELERKVEAEYADDRKLTNAARLFYRFSF